jgi:hypothetical protein
MVQMSKVTTVRPPLEGFQLESEWAQEKGVNQRTPARYRKLGLLEYLEWAGKVWINVASGNELIRSRIKRRNPPRRKRQVAVNSVELSP